MTALADNPQLSQAQRALKTANRVRLARAELKTDIAKGRRTVCDVLRDRPWEAESMPVAALLMSQRRWGRSRCRRFLASIPMVETKPVGGMTDRQRDEIIRRLSPPEAVRAVQAYVLQSPEGIRLHLVAVDGTDALCGHGVGAAYRWRLLGSEEWVRRSHDRCATCARHGEPVPS